MTQIQIFLNENNDKTISINGSVWLLIDSTETEVNMSNNILQLIKDTIKQAIPDVGNH